MAKSRKYYDANPVRFETPDELYFELKKGQTVADPKDGTYITAKLDFEEFYREGDQIVCCAGSGILWIDAGSELGQELIKRGLVSEEAAVANG